MTNPKHISGYLLHLRVGHLPEVQFSVSGVVNVLLELVEGDLIAGFVLAVVVRILLDCVVSEVYVLTAALYAEIFGTRSDIALTVPPCLSTTPKHPHPNIELPAVV